MRMKTDDILTPAETKVVSGYVSGLIGKEIADKIGISYHTVVRHTQNMYEKANIGHSTNALVAWFLETNFELDLAEIKRRIGAFVLLCIVSFQMVVTDFDDGFLRQSNARRVEARARKGDRKGKRKEDGETYEIEM